MKRFDYDENEDFKDDGSPFYGPENEGDISPEEYAEMMRRQDTLSLMQIELANLDLRQRLLFKATKMLEKSFWWKFKSAKVRLAEISLAYHTLRMLTRKE